MKLAAIGFFVLLVLMFFVRSPGTPRTTFVVASDPMVVVSWHAREETLTRIIMPAETHIESVSGYGQYSLRGLWELGEIDPQARTAFPLSIEEALALPIPYYLGAPKGQTLPDFSWTMLLPWRLVTLRTNIPIGTALSLLRHLPFIRPDRIQNVTISLQRGLAPVTAPDGSTIDMLDTNQTDVVIGTLFEEEDIRREAIPIAVYNTTTMGSLGTRIARILSHIGFHVVAVENDEPVIDKCEVRVSRENKDAASVDRVAKLFDCSFVIDEGPKRADIILRVGTRYAQRFLPPVR